MLKNNSKLIPPIALSIIAFSVFYYLVIFLPNKNKKDMEYKESQSLAQEEARCTSSASIYAKELEDSSAYGVSFSVIRYKYNPSAEVLFITNSNTSTSCFMEYNVFFKGGSITNIINVYTKEFMTSISRDEKGIILSDSENSYNSIKIKIFGY